MEAPTCPNCECGPMREVLSLTDLRARVTQRTWECPHCFHRLVTRERDEGPRAESGKD